MLLLNVSANPEILQFHPDHPGPQVDSSLSVFSRTFGIH